jgi:2-polyprenyl-3-methyl-5-hydroxy-6-metoxy-1,4-benzoquinol methylase
MSLKNEKPATWYDEAYRLGGHDGMYNLPASRFADNNIWRKALSQISKIKPIVDMGCGVGMLAELCKETGHKYEAGFDFSSIAIEKARKRVPHTRFEQIDFNKADISFHTDGYVFVFFEILEHLEEDLKLLSQIKPRNKIFISVPNFDSESHVRHFDSMHDVFRRYGGIIRITYEETFQVSDEHKIFLISGERNSR